MLDDLGEHEDASLSGVVGAPTRFRRKCELLGRLRLALSGTGLSELSDPWLFLLDETLAWFWKKEAMPLGELEEKVAFPVPLLVCDCTSAGVDDTIVRCCGARRLVNNNNASPDPDLFNRPFTVALSTRSWYWGCSEAIIFSLSLSLFQQLFLF